MDGLTDFLSSQFSSAKDFTDAWISNTCDSNFSDFESISNVVTPEFFDNDVADQVSIYKNLISLLREMEEHSTSSEIWDQMISIGISGKSMMLLYWYSIERALQKNSNGLDVKSGVAAASCYHYMCCLQGAQAYHIFNPYLYEKCLELFRLIYREFTFDSRSVNTKKTKSKGKGKQKRLEDDANDGDSKWNLEKSELFELLEQATLSLFVLLNKVALSAYKEVSEATALFVRDIAQMDVSKETRIEPCDSVRQFSKLPYISDRSFALMHRLVQEKHSTDGVLVFSRIVFPRLAYWAFDLSVVSASCIPASFTVWKDLMFRFLVYRMKHGEKGEMRSIVKIVDNLYCRCTDRQDYRSKLSQCVVQILLELPRKEQYDFICRLNVFSQNVKTSLRNFTVEIVPQILTTLDINGLTYIPEEAEDDDTTTVQTNETVVDDIDGDDSDEERELARRRALEKKKKVKKIKKTPYEKVDVSKVLYECLIRCCLDKSPAVRGKAIVNVSNLLQDPIHGDNLRRISQEMYVSNPQIITGKYTGGNDGEDKKNNSYTEEDILNDSVEEITNVLFYIIEKAMGDEKAAVRKSGIVAMQSYFGMLDSAVEFELSLSLFKKTVVDASLLVRKQAAETINFILKSKPVYRNHLEVLWLKTVLPLISDREQSVVAVAAKLINETIFQPLMNKDDVVWSLLRKIEQENNHRRLLVRAMFHQASESKLNENIINVLQRGLVSTPENVDVIWMMLAELSVAFRTSNNRIDPSKAVEGWFDLSSQDHGNKVRYIAKVLSSSDEALSASQKSGLVDDIKRRISNYELEATHIPAVYLCLAKLIGAVGEDAKNGAVLRDYGVRLLSDCKRQLRKHLDEFSSEIHMNDGESLSSMELRLIRVITTIGEVIQFSPTLLSACDELVNAFKIIMASADIQADEEMCFKIINSAVPSVNPTPLPSRAGTALGQYGEAQSEAFSQPTSIGSAPVYSQGQAIIPPHLINKKGHFVGVQLFTPLVRAYCVLAIGKFCLMDEKLAKSCVPVLVRQLKVNPDHIIRNNVVFVICDLCIRYTLLVDRYSPIIASCLKDRSTLVRHHTLESLTNLIKEQFIRWEGQIMYRFVSTILDENRAIREYAEFCLKDVLLLQFPEMFYNHFIECVIYFNQVNRKFMPGTAEDLEVDSSLKFSLSGKRNYNARMILYKFMIATFDDKQKFMTMSHICEQIFRPICSGELDFNCNHVKDLLTDAFEIMSSKEIRLNMDVGKGNDEDEEEPSPEIVAAAKNMISSAFRKGFILSIMPPLLEMRVFLLENQSNLIKLCFAVLRAICREHQEQIDEFLAGDKQLKAEIEFDIKKYEEYEIYQRKKEREAAQKVRRARRSMISAAVLMRGVEPVPKEPGTSSEVLPEDPTDEARTPLIGSDTEMDKEPDDDNVEKAAENKQNAENVEEMEVLETVEAPSESNEEDLGTKTKKLSIDVPSEQMEVDHQKENVNSPKESAGKETKDNSLRTRSKHQKEKTTNIEDEEIVDDDKTTNATFAVPKGGRLSQRKRTRLSVSNTLSEEVILGRAISTPNKVMDPNLTFADLNLSAIRGDNEVKPPRSSTRTRRTTLDRINE